LFEFVTDFISIVTLEKPFVDSHESKSEPSILFSNLPYLIIREVCPKSPTYKEFTGEGNNVPEFFQSINIAEIDAPKIAYVRIIF
jgi:hypothetical protein